MEESASWKPPIYDMSQLPHMVHQTHIGDIPRRTVNDFVRVAKWCPDGLNALAQTESGSFAFLDLPTTLLDVCNRDRPCPTASVFPQASPVLDFAWYPSATCWNPATFCFLASVREAPVKLLDASDGRVSANLRGYHTLRASYKIVDHRERQVAPHCLAFNTEASRIFCGFEDAIEVFDINTPGDGVRLHTTPSKKSRDGLKGIVSSLAFSPDPSSGVFAAGSLNQSACASSNIALFTEATGEVPVMFVGNETQGNGFGIRASVMQLMFNPTQPYLLYASFRRHPSLYCWDIRGDVSTPVKAFEPIRDASTDNPPEHQRTDSNQKRTFDIDYCGKWLSIGNKYGDVSVFDLASEEQTEESLQQAARPEVPKLRPTFSFQAHDDCVGSVGFHPLRPLLLSVAGSRHFSAPSNGSDSSESSQESESDDNIEDEPGIQQAVKRSPQKLQPIPRDSSIKLWNF